MIKSMASALALSVCLASGSQAAVVADPSSNPSRVVLDESSGMLWTEFSSLDEGQAQGFRLATDQEFVTLMSQAGLTKIDYSSAPPFAWTIYIDPTRSAMSVERSTDLLIMDPAGLIKTTGVDILNPGYPFVSQNMALVGSTLASGTAYRLTAITATTSVNRCSWVDATGSGADDVTRCGTRTTTHALLDTVRDFGQTSTSTADPVYRSYLQYSGLAASNDLAHDQPTTLGYYMVRAVPEASTASTMSLGLLGLAALGGLKRRKARKLG